MNNGGLMFHRFLLLLTFVTFPLYFSSAQVNQQNQNRPKLQTHNDSAAYSVGFNIGRNILNQIRSDSLPFTLDLIFIGIRDALAQQNPLILESEIQNFVAELQKTIAERRQKQQEQLEKELQKKAEENEKIAKEFLEKNKNQKDINTTPSGLQFKVLKLGNGKKPSENSKVKVHYKGTLIDGTVFDDSYSRGTPAEFEVNKLIPGFKDGLLLMPAGSKFMFYIPPEIGYGSRQVGQIPPNSVLIFEVELLEVQ